MEKVVQIANNISLQNQQEEEYMKGEVADQIVNINFEGVYNAINLHKMEGREKRDFVAILLRGVL